MEKEEEEDTLEGNNDVCVSGSDIGEESSSMSLPARKKARIERGSDFELGDDSQKKMRRVTEITLVLAAMGEMRGGRDPTDLERDLMEEAREKLADLLMKVPPKKLITKEACEELAENFGLNGMNDQKAPAPSKLTIADKMILTMKKLHESRDSMGMSPALSSPVPSTSYSSNVDSPHVLRGDPWASREKVNYAPVMTGFQPFTPISQVSRFASASGSVERIQSNGFSHNSQKHLPTKPSEKQLSSSASLPKVANHFKPVPYGEAVVHSLGTVRDSASGKWSNPFSAHGKTLSGSYEEKNVPVSTNSSESGATTVPSSSQQTNTANSKMFLSGAQPSVSLIFNQPHEAKKLVVALPTRTSHMDIAAAVQKTLQPSFVVHREWKVPSTLYMNSSLTCVICKLTINDVGSVLVCDSCEKGVHLKCLNTYNQTSLPQGDWHCPKCLISNNGKPLQPKYGRLGKASNSSKQNSGRAQPQAEKKNENTDRRSNQKNDVVGSGPALINQAHVHKDRLQTGSVTNDSISTIAEPSSSEYMSSINKSEDGLGQSSYASVAKELPGPVKSIPSSNSNEQMIANSAAHTPSLQALDDLPGDSHNIQQPHATPVGDDKPLQGSSPDEMSQRVASTPTPSLPILDGVPGDADNIQQPHAALVVDKKPLNESLSVELSGRRPDSGSTPASVPLENGNSIQLENSRSVALEETLAYDSSSKKTDESSVKGPSAQNSGNKEVVGIDASRSPVKGSSSITWVGDKLHSLDDKTHYESCCINGIVYKQQDHAFCFFPDTQTPRIGRIEDMWEDNKNGSKWTLVNRYFFPSDLPEVVGLPCTPEESEVYESDSKSNMMIHFIHGPCEVLKDNRCEREDRSRIQLASKVNSIPVPSFLCKWFYDGQKGLFQLCSELAPKQKSQQAARE